MDERCSSILVVCWTIFVVSEVTPMDERFTAFVVGWTLSEVAGLNDRGATLILVACWIVDERYSALVVRWILLEITGPGVDDKCNTLVVCWAILVVREIADGWGWAIKCAGRIGDCGHSIESAVIRVANLNATRLLLTTSSHIEEDVTGDVLAPVSEVLRSSRSN